MEPLRKLAPCLIGTGTVSSFRDMLRALETLDALDFRFVVNGDVMDEGRASLVKLMADHESATLLVNECLFLNVASFRYLDFSRLDEERWRFVLHGDGSKLELTSVVDEERAEREGPRLVEIDGPDFMDALILLDEEDDEE